MEKKIFYIDVLLPLPLPKLYTYKIPSDFVDDIKIGIRVVVQFGRKKIYTALVYKIHNTPPENYSPKEILSIIDKYPIVNNFQIDFWDWLSEYYMCFKGDIMNAALPSAFKLESETKIFLNPDFNRDYSLLNDKEYLVVEALEIQNILTITEVSKILNIKSVISLIKNLIEKHIVIVEEEIKDKYKPKIQSYVKLADKYKNEDNLKELFDTLDKRAHKQLELLMAFIRFKQQDKKEIIKSELIKSAQASAAQYNVLVKKGVFITEKKVVSRFKKYENGISSHNIILNDDQKKAFDEIKENFKEKNVVLLHGVTSSGKTEIYIKLINEYISQGKQVLYLLPEIALTTQIINRLRKYFGDKIGVYHSKYNENEKAEIWYKVLNNYNIKKEVKYQVILGARSAVFLPFSNLGLIIVDEEHDSSYKQYEPSPHYNARDSAIYLAKLHNAKTLLGSATPCVETYFNAKTGKYALVELNSRYGGVQMPEIFVADLKMETRRKTMKSFFSSLLLKYIQDALDKKEQIILFQNRRGFSLRVECEKCGWTPQCKNCDVSLVYHKYFNKMLCHYCGYSIDVPERCPVCGSPVIKMKGFGTEQIEEELSILFPDINIGRLDFDTTRSKNAYQKIIYDFEDHNIDVLIGTQMVTKGLDFGNVSAVGILNADNMLGFPDFRAFERSYQLIAQVSGRAGRKQKRGVVIVQTYNPYNSIIRYAIDNDYQAMYKSQILERKNFNYPPFCRLIKITLKHKDSQLLNEAANILSRIFRNYLGKRILGPVYPVIPRIRNYYLKEMLIKIEKGRSLPEIKTQIKENIDTFYLKNKKFSSVRIIVDVDPL